MLKIGLLFAATMVCLAITGASCQQRNASTELQTEALDPQARQGQALFAHYCDKCHPGGNARIGPSLAKKDLSREVIRVQVRSGKGIMPAFDKIKISDPNLDAIVKYIQSLETQQKP